MAEEGQTVAILCGGRGTRLQERTQTIPKALVEIGGRPILWHVIQIYAAQGFGRFLLLVGHKGNLIERWVAAESWPSGIRIECIDTGEETPTGGRVRRIRDRLGGGTFFVTYADGVADVDLGDLLVYHRSHDALATITVVQPALPFGIAELGGDGAVVGFREKPRTENWVNGGFFCFEPGALDYLADDSTLERELLERLVADGQLRAYRHTGFWDCMDTYKDMLLLNDIWSEGGAPWKVWA